MLYNGPPSCQEPRTRRASRVLDRAISFGQAALYTVLYDMILYYDVIY